jgi:hypothetical protein
VLLLHSLIQRQMCNWFFTCRLIPPVWADAPATAADLAVPYSVSTTAETTPGSLTATATPHPDGPSSASSLPLSEIRPASSNHSSCPTSASKRSNTACCTGFQLTPHCPIIRGKTPPLRPRQFFVPYALRFLCPPWRLIENSDGNHSLA